MSFANTPNFEIAQMLYCDRYRFLMGKDTRAHLYTNRLSIIELMSTHFPNLYDFRCVSLGWKPRDVTPDNDFYVLAHVAASLLFFDARRLPAHAIQMLITHPPAIDMGMGPAGRFITYMEFTGRYMYFSRWGNSASLRLPDGV